MAKRKIHSISFKSKVALEAIRGDQTVAELAAKYQVHPTMVTKWKKQAVEGMSDTFSREVAGSTARPRMRPVSRNYTPR